jgi:peptidoglycan/LPS O-acetylase OafA/YrhL
MKSMTNWIKNTFEISHASHQTIRSMEGIRGFAVFLVFLVHYVTLIEPWLLEGSATFQAAEHIRRIGNLGVDLFFVLSGFLIYGMLIEKPRPFRNYLLRRIQRIYPTFTVVFIVYLVLSLAFPSESKIPGELSDAAIFVAQNYLLLPGLFDVTPIITVAWSLSYEFFYYFLIPILIAALCMRSWSSQQRLLFFISASVFLFGYFSSYGGPIGLLMFIPGILVYEVIRNKTVKSLAPVGLPSLILAIGVAMLLRDLDTNGWWRYAVLYILFFVFCLECFVSSGLTSRIFSISPLRWLGNMSYSYYLIHGLALKAMFLLLTIIYPPLQSDALMFWLVLPPIFLLTLIPSAILFIFVEKPYSLAPKSKIQAQAGSVLTASIRS